MKKSCALLWLLSLLLPSVSFAGAIPLPPPIPVCPDCYASFTGSLAYKASKNFTVALEAGQGYEVRLVPLSGNPNLKTATTAPATRTTPICQPARPGLYPETCLVKATADAYHTITVIGASTNTSQFAVQIIAHPDFDW